MSGYVGHRAPALFEGSIIPQMASNHRHFTRQDRPYIIEWGVRRQTLLTQALLLVVLLSTSLLFDDMRGQDVAEERRRETPSSLPGGLVTEWTMSFVSSIWLNVIVKEDVNLWMCLCVSYVWVFWAHPASFPMSLHWSAPLPKISALKSII